MGSALGSIAGKRRAIDRVAGRLFPATSTPIPRRDAVGRPGPGPCVTGCALIVSIVPAAVAGIIASPARADHQAAQVGAVGLSDARFLTLPTVLACH